MTQGCSPSWNTAPAQLVCNLLETDRRPPVLFDRSSSARWGAFGGLPDYAWVCQPQKKRAAGPLTAAPGAGGGGGAPAGAPGPGRAGGAGAPAVATGTAGMVVLTKKFKMSSVFDQGDDTEVSTGTAARLRTVMAAFKAANEGEEPDQDEEVTAYQLAALEHRLYGGAGPCLDFGVWCPYGHRLARQLRLSVHHITPGGDYVPYEVAGPPSFNEWLAFRVLQVD